MHQIPEHSETERREPAGGKSLYEMYTLSDLSSRSGRRQIEAAIVLGTEGNDAAIPGLTRMFLGKTWTEVREESEGVYLDLIHESAKALARIGTDESFDVLLQTVREKPPCHDTQIAAIYAMETCDSHLVLSILFEALNSKDKKIRTKAAEILEKKKQIPGQFHTGIMNLLGSSSFSIVLSGVSAAGTLRLKESIPLLRRFFEEPMALAPSRTWFTEEGQCDHLRALAARGLGRAGDCDYLREMLSRPDSTTVIEMEIPARPAYLTFQMRPPGTIWDKALSVISGLKHREESEVAEPCRVRLELNRSNAAAMGLFAAGETNHLSVMDKILKTGRVGPGIAAVQILGDLASTEIEARQYLKIVAESPEHPPSVGDAAKNLLNKLGTDSY